MKRLYALFITALALCNSFSLSAQTIETKRSPEQIKEERAYAIGMQKRCFGAGLLLSIARLFTMG